MEKKIIAVIPARGQSKGIPYKNIAYLAGKPLIYYSINVAKKSRYIERIIVSTDDEKIARVAKKYNVEILMRPSDLAQDDTPDFPVFKHVVDTLKEKEGEIPDIIINLRPTCPLRNEEDIDNAVKKMIDTGCDSVRTITEAKHHPYWMGKLKDDHLVPFIDGIDVQKYYQRQLLPHAFIINGGVDVMNVKNIIENNTLYGKDIRAVFMPFERSVDIDTPFDLQFAEFFLQQKNGG
jgi:CMP-N,N'-diacetyllegionaminic acid synthase